MSEKRQGDLEAQVLVRGYAVTHPRDLDLPRRALAGYSQLAYAARGVMEVETPEGRWVAPPLRALWIPAGVQHSVHMAGEVAVRTLYFKRGLGRGRVPRTCRAVGVTPLLRQLILHAARTAPLYRDRAQHQRLAQVIVDQLEVADAVALQLPWPRDERAQRLARSIVETPGRSLAELTVAIGASKRTLERAFVRDTALTLGRWHQRARLLAAIRGLARGRDVLTVALDVGYQSASAFVAAFRKQLGTTPGRYFHVGHPT